MVDPSVADPQGMKPCAVIASAAKQSGRRCPPPVGLASSPAAPSKKQDGSRWHPILHASPAKPGSNCRGGNVGPGFRRDSGPASVSSRGVGTRRCGTRNDDFVGYFLLDHAARCAMEVAPREGVRLSRAAVCFSMLIRTRNVSRPRDSRERTVPTGICRICATRS
jgi:hypothetical protein